jgi:hypothetical protein
MCGNYAASFNFFSVTAEALHMTARGEGVFRPASLFVPTLHQ